MTADFSLSLRHLSSGLTFEHRLRTPTALAGSDPRCPFRLPASVAGAKQMLFQVVDGRLYCLALGDSEDRSRVRKRSLNAAGVEVHGFAIRAFEEHAPGTELERSLNLAAADGGDEALAEGEFELAMLNERRRSTVVPLDRKVTIMGRSSRCRVSFNSWAASRFHAACIVTGNAVWILDLASRSGTLVNEKPVQYRRLRVGDQVRIGSSRFEFRAVQDAWEDDERPAPPRVAPSAGTPIPTPFQAPLPTRADTLGEPEEPVGEDAAVAEFVREPKDNEIRSLVTTRPPSKAPRPPVVAPADSEMLSLVSTLANAFSHAEPQPLATFDSRSIVRVLNELLRVQALQLEEVRRLNAILAANGGVLPALQAPPTPAPAAKPKAPPLKASGQRATDDVEPDVHEWFQEHNDAAADQNLVAGFLRRMIGNKN